MEREGEREGEKHQCVVASHAPPLGTWPATQACALTRNRTSDPWFTAHAQPTELHQRGLHSLFNFRNNQCLPQNCLNVTEHKQASPSASTLDVNPCAWGRLAGSEAGVPLCSALSGLSAVSWGPRVSTHACARCEGVDRQRLL